jgi:hypothetical protein
MRPNTVKHSPSKVRRHVTCRISTWHARVCHIWKFSCLQIAFSPPLCSTPYTFKIVQPSSLNSCIRRSYIFGFSFEISVECGLKSMNGKTEIRVFFRYVCRHITGNMKSIVGFATWYENWICSRHLIQTRSVSHDYRDHLGGCYATQHTYLVTLDDVNWEPPEIPRYS